MTFKVFNIPWDRVADDLQRRLEVQGITVLALSFRDGQHSKWGTLAVPAEDSDKVKALDGLLYGGRKLRIRA